MFVLKKFRWEAISLFNTVYGCLLMINANLSANNVPFCIEVRTSRGRRWIHRYVVLQTLRHNFIFGISKVQHTCVEMVSSLAHTFLSYVIRCLYSTPCLYCTLCLYSTVHTHIYAVCLLCIMHSVLCAPLIRC